MNWERRQRMTEEQALVKVKDMGGNSVQFHPVSSVCAVAYYRVAKIHAIGFEWEGVGSSWEEAFANIEGRSDECLL
jgi:hypothetical protein